MKFIHLIKNNVRNILFKIHAENEAGRLVPDTCFFLTKNKKKLYME